MTHETITINLPDIGEGVAEGEVIEWLKEVGASVKQDEPVVVVMTDKVTVELPAPYPGVLVKQYHKPGSMAIKAQPLYDLEVAAALISNQPKKAIPKKENAPQHNLKSDASEKKSSDISIAGLNEKTAETGHIYKKALATPKARLMAKMLGIDINSITNLKGEAEIFSQEDLRQYVQEKRKTTTEMPFCTHKTSKKAAPIVSSSTPAMRLEDDEVKPIVGLRNLIAEKMVESKYLIPHFSFFDQMDATRLIQLRDNLKGEAANLGIKLTYMPFFIKALSMSLLKYPQINGSVDMSTNELIIHKQHHIGIAMQLPTGLMVVVLKNVERMSLFTLIQAYEALKAKAQEGRLEISDMKDSTITISNFGVLGGMWATPIINYPEIAILGVAKIRKQPVIRNDEVVARSMLNLSWSFDHRVIDGEAAAQFSNYFISLLENPAGLL